MGMTRTAPDNGTHSDERETRPMSRSIKTNACRGNVGRMASRWGGYVGTFQLNPITCASAAAQNIVKNFHFQSFGCVASD